MSSWSHPIKQVEDVLLPGRIPLNEVERTPQARTEQRSLATVFPACLSLPVWFDRITVPAGLPAPVAGASYVYGLRRFRVGKDGQLTRDSVLLGAYFQLRPTDWNGKGTSGSAGSSASWGDNRGQRAAIIIGRNLPNFVEFGWSQIVAPLPGIEGNTAGAVNADRTVAFLMSQSFPPGDWGDTAPQTAYIPRALAPAAVRLTEGNTLDVGLVLSGAQVNTISNTGMPKTIIGYANVDVYVASTQQDTDFRA